METLKKLYEEEIVPNMVKKFNYTTKMQVPRLEKIVLNMGVGDAITDQKYFENLVTKTIRTAPDIYAEAWQDKLLMDYQMALYRGLLSPWQKEILEIKLQAAGIL